MLSSSSSSSAATVRVDKATSDLLIGPDWTMNIDICDSINTNHWQAKDVVKAVKRRIQHRNPKVQLLALTLLETMVKNCGDYVHFQIAERNILQEMIKIVKKKTDMSVRDKILALLLSWQEAFGGPGGKHPQYYWAYEELRRSGIEFPQRSSDAAPIFTPPVSHPTLGPQAGYGMPSNSSRRLDEAMASEIESLSLSSLDTMRDVMDLLSDMLQAVNPSDRMAVKDEVIVDLVSQCRSNQKKLMQMLTSTGDEELLGRGLELNDSLQSLLSRYDAIASGLPLPTQVTNFSPRPTEAVSSSSKPNEVRDSSPRPNTSPVAAVRRNHFEEDEEEEDDFSQLARRHSKPQSGPSQSTETSEGSTSLIPSNTTTSSAPTASIPSLSNALTLPDPPAPVRTTKEQDIIDLLSITLSTTSPHTPHAPHTPHTPAATQNVHQAPIAPSTPGYPHASQPYPGNQGQVPYNSYVVPWAQAQPQPQHQHQHQPQPQPQPQPQAQPQVRPQYPQYQYSSGYPPPPWAATPGYANNQSSLSTTTTSSTPQANISASYMPMQQGVRPLQQHNSFPTRGSNGSLMHGDPRMSSTPRNPAPSAGQATFIPSYRLFEDLNVFGNADGKLKMTSSTSPSLSGTSGQGMVGGRK